MRLELGTSALPVEALELLRDVLDVVHELATAGATRVEAVSVLPQGDESLRVLVTSDKLDAPKVISFRESE